MASWGRAINPRACGVTALVLLCCGLTNAASADCTAYHERGLKLKLAQQQLFDGCSSLVLSQKVFYGRPVIRLPDAALLQPDEGSKLAVQRLLERAPELRSGSFAQEAEEVLGLALALLRAKRHECQSWFDAIAGVQPPLALQLTEKQRLFLAGTTVEESCTQIVKFRDALVELADFGEPLEAAESEAAWALGVVMRHALHSLQPDAERRALHLAVVPELLRARRHPDSTAAPLFMETSMAGRGEGEVKILLRPAGGDLPSGEEIFLWSGRLSDSELLVRGQARAPINGSMPRNPTGIGGNLSIPENWNPNPRTPNFREFLKFNCTSEEAFEVRLSPKGWPTRTFVRCYRVAWLLMNGWYSPKVINQTQLLDKWPPPRKYKIDDWLGWTQADQAVNDQILRYCNGMRNKLRDSIHSSTAEEFRESEDPTDKLLWKLRNEESRTFKECIALSRATATPSGDGGGAT